MIATKQKIDVLLSKYSPLVIIDSWPTVELGGVSTGLPLTSIDTRCLVFGTGTAPMFVPTTLRHDRL